jgi:hypothetical protein
MTRFGIDALTAIRLAEEGLAATDVVPTAAFAALLR